MVTTKLSFCNFSRGNPGRGLASVRFPCLIRQVEELNSRTCLIWQLLFLASIELNEMPIARHYAMTVWPKNLLSHSSLKEWFEFAKANTAGITYLVIQHEHGTKEGGHHVQGFVTAATKKRPSTLGIHFQCKPEAFQKMKPASNPQKNRAYCTDDSKRLPGTDFFEYGTVPGAQPNKIETLCDIVKEHGLKRAIDSDPATFVRHCNGLEKLDNHYKRQKVRGLDMWVVVIYGPSGAGKSYWAKQLYDPGNTYTLPAVPRSGQAWFDHYDGQRTLLIDEFSGRIEFELFKNMLDPYEMQCPIKGTYTQAMWDTVLITTNFHPCSWYGNDVDPWGTESVSPVQRRIDWFIEATGIYNKGTHQYVVNNWASNEISPVLTVVPTRRMLDEANAAQSEDVDAASPYEHSSAAATVLTEPKVDTTGAADPDPTVEELDAQWERLDNEFGAVLDPNWGEPDPDNVLLGTDGDSEPLKGIDLSERWDVF